MSTLTVHPKRTICIVDDEADVVGMCCNVFMKSYQPVAYTKAEQALEDISTDKIRPSLLVTDIRMPSMDGLTLIRKLKELNKCPPTVLISGYADKDYMIQALEYGVVSVLEKPFSLAKLEELVLRIMARSASISGLSKLVEKYEDAANTSMQLANSYMKRYVSAENFIFENNLDYPKSSQDKVAFLSQMKKEQDLEKNVEKIRDEIRSLGPVTEPLLTGAVTEMKKYLPDS